MVILLSFILVLILTGNAGAQLIRSEMIESEVIDGSVAYCADAGASDAYACTLSPAPTSYVVGTNYRFKANTANTGAATINFNSLGAKTIKKWVGGSKSDLATGDIGAGQIVAVSYDGTDMVATSLGGGGGGGGVSGLTTGTIPKAASSSSLNDSAIAQDADSVNISLPVEIGSVGTNALIFNTSAITGAKTYSAARNVSGDLMLSTGSLPTGHYPVLDSSSRLIDSKHGITGARVYNNANQSINTSTDTVVTFNSERFDTDTMHSTVSNTDRMTAITAGKYLLGCNIAYAANDVGQRYIRIQINGTNVIAEQMQLASSNVGATRVAISTVWDMAANDYAQCGAFQDSGGNLDVISQNNSTPEFFAWKLD